MPAFAHWAGTITPNSQSQEIISTMDILPSLVTLAGGAARLSGRVLDGKPSLASILLDNSGTAKSAHSFLPFCESLACATHRDAFACVCLIEAGMCLFCLTHVLVSDNNPVIANASSVIFAARFGKYKVHWITSPGLGGGRYACHSSDPDCHGHASAVEWHRATPLVFDVEADPSETLPVVRPQI